MIKSRWSLVAAAIRVIVLISNLGGLSFAKDHHQQLGTNRYLVDGNKSNRGDETPRELLYIDLQGYLPIIGDVESSQILRSDFKDRIVRALDERINDVFNNMERLKLENADVDAANLESAESAKLRGESSNEQSSGRQFWHYFMRRLPSERVIDEVAVQNKTADVQEDIPVIEKAISPDIAGGSNSHSVSPQLHESAFVITLARKPDMGGSSLSRLSSRVAIPFHSDYGIQNRTSTGSSYIVTETNLVIPTTENSESWVKKVSENFSQNAFAVVNFPSGESFKAASSISLENISPESVGPSEDRLSNLLNEFRSISSVEASKRPVGEPGSEMQGNEEYFNQEQVILGRRLDEKNQLSSITENRPLGFNFGNGGGMSFPDGTTINFGGGGGVYVGYPSQDNNEGFLSNSETMEKVKRLFVAALARSLNWNAINSAGLVSSDIVGKCCTPIAIVDKEAEVCMSSCVSCKLEKCCVIRRDSNDGDDDAENYEGVPKLFIANNETVSATPASACNALGYYNHLASTQVSFRPVVSSMDVEVFLKSPKVQRQDFERINTADCKNGWPTREAIEKWKFELSHASSVNQFFKIWLNVLGEIRSCITGSNDSSTSTHKTSSAESSGMTGNECVVQHIEIKRKKGDKQIGLCIQACVSPAIARMNILLPGPCASSDFRLISSVPEVSGLLQKKGVSLSSGTSVWASKKFSSDDDKRSGNWLIESFVENEKESRESHCADKTVCCASSSNDKVGIYLELAGSLLREEIQDATSSGGYLEQLFSQLLDGESAAEDIRYSNEKYFYTTVYQPTKQQTEVSSSICEDVSDLTHYLQSLRNDQVKAAVRSFGSGMCGETDKNQNPMVLHKWHLGYCNEFEVPFRADLEDHGCLLQATMSILLGLETGGCSGSQDSRSTMNVVSLKDQKNLVTCRVGIGYSGWPAVTDIAKTTIHTKSTDGRGVWVKALARFNLINKLISETTMSLGDDIVTENMKNLGRRLMEKVLVDYGLDMLLFINIHSGSRYPQSFLESAVENVKCDRQDSMFAAEHSLIHQRNFATVDRCSFLASQIRIPLMNTNYIVNLPIILRPLYEPLLIRP